MTLFGVVFSTYLTLTETALYIGMMGNATSIIRHAGNGADLWIASKGVQNFDFAKPFPDDRLKRLQARNDLVWAKPISLSWGFLKLPDGAQELVEIIGYDPAAPVGGPWDMASGAAGDVGGRQDDRRRERRATARRASRRESVEVNDRPLKLVGLSRGGQDFHDGADCFHLLRACAGDHRGISRRAAAAYIAIKLRDPADAERVASSLRRELRENEILTTRVFVDRTILYWTIQTGMGAAFCLTALLGLVVGAGTIGQTVFANTMEHLGEFATLKAMGASPGDLNAIILAQAAIDAAVGFVVAAPLAILNRSPLERMGVSLGISPLLSPWPLLRNPRHGARGGLFLDPQGAKTGSRDNL